MFKDERDSFVEFDIFFSPHVLKPGKLKAPPQKLQDVALKLKLVSC